MSARIWLKLAEILVPVLLAITIFVSWQGDRRERAHLATQLAAAQQTLAQIAAQKQTTATPAQILQDLPSALSLPAPITLQTQSTQTTASIDGATGAKTAQGHARRAPKQSNPKTESGRRRHPACR